MPSVLLIDKSCSIKSSVITKFTEEDLFKKAGFKSPNGFAKHVSWNLSILNEQYTIELYGKITGRAGQENKYEFPPPADNILFFGTCLLVCRKKSTRVVVDITVEQWNAVYAGLHGGFEDIDGTSSEDSRDEEKAIPVSKKTKAGYLKDDFVVEDDSDLSSQPASDEELELDREPVKPQKSRRVTTSKNKNPPPPLQTQPVKRIRRKEQPAHVPLPAITEKEVIATITNNTTTNVDTTHISTTATEEENYLGCTNELCEEEYLPDE